MNEKNKNKPIKKSLKNKNINISKRELLKLKLINKYNISQDEAEAILIKIENKENIVMPNNHLSTDEKNHISKNSFQKLKSQQTKQESIISEQNTYNNQKIVGKKSIPKEENLNELPSDAFINQSSIKITNNSEFDPYLIDEEDNLIRNNLFKEQIPISPTSNKFKSQDIDSIISNFIPNYNQDISIELENVNLSFEVVNDRIDTLKESIIRTLKRDIPKKVNFKALKNVSFKIYKGEKIGVIGYNGAGKSTLLKVITGIYPPDSGKVITKGNISPLLSLGAGFDMNYSGRKNIYLNGAVLGYKKQFLQKKEKEIIEFSELEEFIDFPIKNYSSGMLAKLGFSIATIVNPDILIIDEILSVGDVNFQRKSADKIRSLMDGGTTVILVSHSIPQIKEICDKAIWIDNGHVREIGEVNLVCDNYINDSKKASEKQLKNIQFE